MSLTKTASYTWEQVEKGNSLPEQTRKITAALIAGGAISATHDYTPVHHDYKAAQAAGADDIFMNILTTNGLIGKYLTDSLGVDCEIKKITVKLAVPNYPGNNLVLSGTVADKYMKDGEKLIEIDFVAKNELGYHAAGKAILAMN